VNKTSRVVGLGTSLRNIVKLDCDFLSKRGSDSLEHGERVSIVIRIFKSGDDGLFRANPLGKLGLRKRGPLSGLINKLCDSSVHTRFRGEPF
jgi:hypothetical protein